MILIIDGTADANHRKYAQEMANGFCMRLMRKAKGRYWRGPELAGWKVA